MTHTYTHTHTRLKEIPILAAASQTLEFSRMILGNVHLDVFGDLFPINVFIYLNILLLV